MNWIKPKCKTSDKVALIEKMYSGCYFIVRVVESAQNKQQLQMVCEMANLYNDMIDFQIERFRKSTTANIRDSFKFCLDEISDNIKERYQELCPPKPVHEYKDPCQVRGFGGMLIEQQNHA